MKARPRRGFERSLLPLALAAAAPLLAGAAPRRAASAPVGDPSRACTVQALGVETQRMTDGKWTKSTDFYPGDASIMMLCRYRTTCTPTDAGMPIDVGFQLDGTTFSSSSSADSKHLTTLEYVVAGQVNLPQKFTPEMVWPHSHAAGCVVDLGKKLGEDASDNVAQQPVVFRPTPPEPAPASPARPPAPVPGMTLTPELRFIGVKPHTPPTEGGAVAQRTDAGTPNADVRRQLQEEGQRARDYLARLKSRAPGGDRPPDYVPDFPGIARPVHLTSVPEMENYIRMVDGRLATVNEQAARPAPQGAGTPSSGAAERTVPPTSPVAEPPSRGAAVANLPGALPAGIFGVRVPYRFTDVHGGVDAAVIQCSASTGASTAGNVGWGRSTVELNGQDRSGFAQMTFQPLSGHTLADLEKARSYRCWILTFHSGAETHAVIVGSPDPVILPAWAAAAKGSVLSVEGGLTRRK